MGRCSQLNVIRVIGYLFPVFGQTQISHGRSIFFGHFVEFGCWTHFYHEPNIQAQVRFFLGRVGLDLFGLVCTFPQTHIMIPNSFCIFEPQRHHNDVVIFYTVLLVGTEDYIDTVGPFFQPGSPFQQFISYGPLGFTYLDRPACAISRGLGERWSLWQPLPGGGVDGGVDGDLAMTDDFHLFPSISIYFHLFYFLLLIFRDWLFYMLPFFPATIRVTFS